MHISLMTKGIRQKEVHQGNLLLKIQKEGVKNHYLILNASIATRKVIMHVIVLRIERGHDTTLEATTIIKEEKDNQRNNHDRRYAIRRRDSSSHCEEEHPPQKNSRDLRYESNVGNKSEYILISALASSSPPDSWDGWLVDSGGTHHFSTRKPSLIW